MAECFTAIEGLIGPCGGCAGCIEAERDEWRAEAEAADTKTAAAARREGREAALRECLDIAMAEGSTSVIVTRIHNLLGDE